MFDRKHSQQPKWRFGITFLVILLSLCTFTAFAQDITSGTIQGIVSDEQGAVVPGVTVEARNVDTNFSKTFTTDADGRFTFLSMPSGKYTVSFIKQGFAKLNQEGVELTVGRLVNLNPTLKVSSVSGEVTVTGSPTIDSVKTESSSTINENAISNTPVLGRKFEDLLTLTPGVAITQGPDGDEINFAGQRGVFNNVSLDGGDYNNGFFGEQAGGQRAAIDIALDAVKEFQVIATGASAEYGRTAGGIINVITKSGSNDVRGSLFYNQRLKALSSNTSDDKPLQGFHREQFGGTIGGPIKKDRAFFFVAYEQIMERLTRPNLSEQVGATPCPIGSPTIGANEALINSNPDCQRLALVNFIRSTRTQEEGVPVEHKVRNSAFLGKVDWDITRSNRLSASYNFDYSKNTNQTFDVPTYGASANGTEGPSKINVFNANLYSTLSPTMLNEAHFTYSREERPRAATDSNVPADTAMGFGTTFRFGHPFFLNPNVDETFWRTQIRDTFSIVAGSHNIKVGGEWVHSLNDQVFRGFFQGRYIFDSVAGFLRYASPAGLGGFGPDAGECFSAAGAFTGWITQGLQTCPVGSSVGGPLLLYLQNGIPTGISGVPAPGASNIKNEDYGLFAQDKWQIWPNFTLNYGLRWEAQIFPDPVVPPSQTAYGPLLNNPSFPSDGTLHSDKKEWQPRVGFAWDITKKGKSVLRASYGRYFGRQNMLTQVGSITDNGVQQFGIACGSSFGCSVGGSRPVWPNVRAVPPSGGIPAFASVRVFSKDYENPRIDTANLQFEHELITDLALYVDYTHSKGVHLTRFFNYNRLGLFPTLGDVFVASSNGKSVYDGFTVGMRKRFSHRYQLEWNYVLSKDKDDDSNERDPFTDRSINPLNPGLDYSLSDRDIRHKFNFFAFVELPWKLEFTPRVQARSAQPATPIVAGATSPLGFALVNGETSRNTLRKDNKYFSFDWRLARPFKLSETVELIPTIEMFNTFNNDNFINSLSGAGNQSSLTAPSLFNFDGFLRQGIGDPRQVQLSLRLKF
ncbi:MAG TPA: TonB-dependent receptor [Pyrinomonadaceae bacterium]|nr:TonB-dependent receptor [Pyrinomonadaceae bacterium]